MFSCCVRLMLCVDLLWRWLASQFYRLWPSLMASSSVGRGSCSWDSGWRRTKHTTQASGRTIPPTCRPSEFLQKSVLSLSHIAWRDITPERHWPVFRLPSVRTSILENIELAKELICSHEKSQKSKISTKLKRRWTFYACLFDALQSMIFIWKSVIR